MLKKSIIIVFIAMLFPVLLFSEMNPALKINPMVEKKLSDIKDIKLKRKYLEQIESFSFSKDRGPWKYDLSVKNPKQTNILAKVFGRTQANKEVLLASSMFIGTSLSKTFDNKQYKSLRVIIYKNGMKGKKIKLDQKYVNLPKIKAEVVELNATPRPNKAWSFKIRNKTSVPMKFSVSLIEEEASGTNHGISSYETETLAPNGIHTKSGVMGFLNVGNNVSLTIRDIPTNGVLSRKVVPLQ